jgi:alpha-tubulin suppressor-like RCC1 family protein
VRVFGLLCLCLGSIIVLSTCSSESSNLSEEQAVETVSNEAVQQVADKSVPLDVIAEDLKTLMTSIEQDASEPFTFEASHFKVLSDAEIMTNNVTIDEVIIDPENVEVDVSGKTIFSDFTLKGHLNNAGLCGSIDVQGLFDLLKIYICPGSLLITHNLPFVQLQVITSDMKSHLILALPENIMDHLDQSPDSDNDEYTDVIRMDAVSVVPEISKLFLIKREVVSTLGIEQPTYGVILERQANTELCVIENVLLEDDRFVLSHNCEALPCSIIINQINSDSIPYLDLVLTLETSLGNFSFVGVQIRSSTQVSDTESYLARIIESNLDDINPTPLPTPPDINPPYAYPPPFDPYVTAPFYTPLVPDPYATPFMPDPFATPYNSPNESPIPTPEVTPLETPSDRLTGVTNLSIGVNFTCAVLLDEGLVCWGRNQYATLGNNSRTHSFLPIKTLKGVSPSASDFLENVKDISTGSSATCAVVDESGTNYVYCWGYHVNGSLGVTITTSTNAVYKQTPTKVLEGDSGTSNTDSELYLRDVTQISNGVIHSCAINSRGTYCWGQGSHGRLGINSSNHQATPTRVQSVGLENFDAQTLFRGLNSHCAISSSNQAYCWGRAFVGVLGIGTLTDALVATPLLNEGGTPPPITTSSIAIFNYHGCMIRSTDGAALCMGNGATNFLAMGSPVAIAVTTSPIIITEQPANTVYVDIATSNSTTCARTQDKRVMCWGKNDNGELGRSGLASHIPQFVRNPEDSGDLIDVEQLSGYSDHYCALLTDTSVVCWGKNDTYGALGIGNASANTSNLPVYVKPVQP